MNKSAVQNKDICSGPVFQKFLLFSLPIMAMNMLQLMFNAADMVVVGRFSGKEALAAVGATSALINLIINTFLGLSVGTSVAVAQDYGANDEIGVSRCVHTSILVSILGGMLVMTVGLIFCAPLLRMTGTPEDIIRLSTLYMKIYFAGVPANMVFNFAAAVLRAVGDSRHPMYYLVLSGVINVILNLFFVLVFKTNVEGVALATVISQYLAMVLVLICLMRSHGAIQLDLKKLKIYKQKLSAIVQIGLPAGLQSALFSISNVLIQSAINSFGSALVAGNSAASNIDNFVGTSMNAYYNAAITFTGQNVGAKKYTRINRITWVCIVLMIVTWITLCTPILIFGRQLLGIFTTDPEVIDLGMVRVTIMMYTYLSCCVMNVFPGLTRGMGYSVLPMMSTLIGACLMRIVWLVTFFKWYPTVFVLFLCYPVTWTLSGIGQIASYFYARHKIFARGDMVPDN